MGVVFDEHPEIKSRLSKLIEQRRKNIRISDLIKANFEDYLIES
jgi:hypothetical protein